ncbi:MAG TPA: UDP-glucose--hexose-1-phosphate uridylyltransferase [Candidatus Baltobacteraceae bacterium]|nr:UDP-glucose--hexose-1-phosphate uridylyltransferase [Candidatus Baltobacteraceae bacterium]
MTAWMNAPHRRYNPLLAQWVLVSPHRAERPWLGERETPPPATVPAYDPHCYLCPGNERANGARNPRYDSVYVFDNDFPALLPQTPHESMDENELLVARSERGRCRVVCFSPRHDLHLAALPQPDVRRIVDVWAAESEQLGAQPEINAVTIFENRGAMMGASNPHPHGQIWTNEHVPNDLAVETRTQAGYLRSRGSCLLCAYAEHEVTDGTRAVYANEHVAALVPFWAAWPYELLVLPRRHRPNLAAFASAERDALAAAMRDLTARYDRLFATPFPYSMGLHQQPSGEGVHDEWHAHAHYFPPLLRSASVRKYMVGYEMLAQPQRDLTPEAAAERLRAV